MGFLDIATNKTSRTASARASLAALKRRRTDCLTFHRLTAYHLFLASYFDATLTTGIARGTGTLWSSS